MQTGKNMKCIDTFHIFKCIFPSTKEAEEEMKGGKSKNFLLSPSEICSFLHFYLGGHKRCN